MAQFYSALTPELREFVVRQQMFFTATAAAEGRVNLSPKGMDTFRVLGPARVAYLDLTGSGNETAARLSGLVAEDASGYLARAEGLAADYRMLFLMMAGRMDEEVARHVAGPAI